MRSEKDFSAEKLRYTPVLTTFGPSTAKLKPQQNELGHTQINQLKPVG